MATKLVDVDGAVVATFTASDTDADHVRMGSLIGATAIAQIAVAGEFLQGSNDGTNFTNLHAATVGANEMAVIPVVPLLIRNPTANTGGIVVVGYQAQ